VRWFLAGLAFAAFIAIAIVTATVRAENSIRRYEIEQRYIQVRDRLVERRRLEADLLDSESSRRLARAHWAHLEAEFQRRRGRFE